MATNNYTTKTAALKATKADINKLDAKKMLLNGKNILDYISDSEFNSYDTRDPQLKNDELDLWNTEINLSDNGHIEVKPQVHSVKYDNGFIYEVITETQLNSLKTAVKVIDNEVLGANDEHIMYWQTDGLTHAVSMFDFCENLTTFSSDLSSLTCGAEMFYCCNNLTTFNSDLSSLTEGDNMFNECENLISFSCDLPKLKVGFNMFFGCSKLTTFTPDLPSLTDGESMFMRCSSLTSFSSDLSSLTDGSSMFEDCNNLVSFTSNLSSLTTGVYMFDGCKLDAQSVANIVHTLPTHETNGTIYIGIGCNATVEDQVLFTQECDCDTWQELLDDFSAKNWTVSFSFNGRPTTTYNMRRGETLPVYTKLEEVTEGEPYAYTSTDGSKFYNINYFHSTNGSTEGYDVFSSLEEAINSYGVTPKN